MSAHNAPHDRGGMSNTGFIGYFVRHRTAANLLLTLIVVCGVVAGLRIRAQFFPDIAIETATVSIVWRGVGPKEMDDAIVARVEPKLRAIEGVKTAKAVAREGAASFTLEFQPGWDMATAMDEVKAAVDEVRDLPEDAEEPVIKRKRWHDTVTDVVISGDVGIGLLERYAEQLKTRLFQLGITNTEIDGISDPEIRIDVRPEALERYGITLQTVANAIKSETGTQPVGEIHKGAARIRTAAQELTASAVGAVAVRSLPDGTKLRVADIANIIEEGLDREIAMYHQGVPAVVLDISRDANGDAIRMQRQVEAAIAEFQPTLPEGVKVFLAHPRAQQIIDRLDLLIDNGITGLAIVVVLLFLFLNARTAVWVAAGIPVAMAATVGLMYAFGFTFNMISLFALIICLGIVVDDAIIIGEHSDHLARKGLSPAVAATTAAERMLAPVFSAAITTVIAFGVLSLIGGRFGRMLSDMPFTVAVVLLASLMESFLILPAHMRHALMHTGQRSFIDLPSEYVNRGFAWFLERVFRPLMRIVMTLRYPVVAAAVLLLAFSVTALMDRTVTWRFFSSPERPTVRANLAMTEGATRADTRAMIAELDRALKAVNDRYEKEYGTAPVKMALAKLGGNTGRGLKGADTKEPDQLAGYDIELIDPDLRPYSAAQFIADWEAEVRPTPFLETLALRGDRSGPGGDDISVLLAGSDENVLKSAAEALKASLARFPAATGVEDDLAYDKPELVVTLTPKGEALGFTTETVARALRERLDGIEAVTLARGSREIIARVRLSDADTGRDFLHQAFLPIPDGGFAPINEIATITELHGFSSIRRENGLRRVTVSGDLPDDAVAAEEVMRALRDEILPGIAGQFGVEWSMGGLAEQEGEFFTEALTGFLLAMVGIYAVLAWVNGSWTRPATIMLVIPFGLIGAIWGHWLHDVPMSMFSVVGLIGMAGIIINDSIVLVTTVDERATRQDMTSAIVDGTCDRLRAIFLTTATTVGGLAPLAFETSRQALFLKPTVLSLGYGLGFGMLLVLLVTPSMLAIQHDIGMSLKSFRRYAKVRRRARNGARLARVAS